MNRLIQSFMKCVRMAIPYTPFTQGLRPWCLPCAITKPTRSPLTAQRRLKDRPGRSRVAQRTSRPRHAIRSVVHRSLKGGRRKAQASPWSQNGCTGVGHWSPRKKNAHCYKHYVSIWAMLLHYCVSLDRPIASIERYSNGVAGTYTHIAKTIGSISTWYRSDAKVLDRCF